MRSWPDGTRVSVLVSILVVFGIWCLVFGVSWFGLDTTAFLEPPGHASLVVDNGLVGGRIWEDFPIRGGDFVIIDIDLPYREADLPHTCPPD